MMKKRPRISWTLFFLILLAVPGLVTQVSQPADAEIYHMRMERTGSAKEWNHTLGPGENNSYFITVGSDCSMKLDLEVTGVGQLDLFKVTGHTENHSDFQVRRRNTSSYLIVTKLYEGENFSLILCNEGEGNVSYLFSLTPGEPAKDYDPSETGKWAMYLVGGIALVTVPLAFLAYQRTPRYKRIFRILVESPVDQVILRRQAVQDAMPQEEDYLQGTLNITRKHKGRFSRDPASCPHCGKFLGVSENRYQINTITIILPVYLGSLRSERYMTPITIYCEHCQKIVGVTY